MNYIKNIMNIKININSIDVNIRDPLCKTQLKWFFLWFAVFYKKSYGNICKNVTFISLILTEKGHVKYWNYSEMNGRMLVLS